jgi:hypothetical protein
MTNALCGQETGTVAHLLLGCVLARQLWFLVWEPVGLVALVPERPNDLTEWWMEQRLRLHHDARPPFDSLLLLISWTLWKERNSRTFQGVASGIQVIYKTVVEEAEDCVQAGFSTLAALCPPVVAKIVSYVLSAL